MVSFSTPPSHSSTPILSFILFGDCLFKTTPQHLRGLFMLSLCLEILLTLKIGNESWVAQLEQILRCRSRMGKLQGGS